MPNTKPLVAAAFVCEKVLHEKDDVITVVRIVDRFMYSVDPRVPSDTTPGIPLTAFISLKSGDLKGKSMVSFRLRKPTGQIAEFERNWPVLLNGDEHGTNLVMNFVLDARTSGLYWLDVVWNRDVLTSIPIRLVARSDHPQPDKK